MNIWELSKALSYFEYAMGIFERTLPSSHPDLQAVRKNIEIVKTKNKLNNTVHK